MKIAFDTATVSGVPPRRYPDGRGNGTGCSGPVPLDRPDEAAGRRTIVILPTWQTRLMGELAVSQGNRRWAGPQIGSRRARILLGLLVVEAGRLVGLDEIVDTLWPEDRPRRPAASVATLVSRLRATFEAEVISGGRRGYRLGEHVRTDLSTAGELVVRAEAHLTRHEYRAAQAAAEGALRLMDDDVLPELVDESWVVPPRTLRVRLRRQAWHAGADAAWRAGDPRAALGIAEAAMTAEPFDEKACRMAMRACYTLGQPAEALRVYHRLRHTLAMDLGVETDAQTQDLYLAILRGERPDAVAV